MRIPETFPVQRLLVGVSGAVATIMVAPNIGLLRTVFGVGEIRVVMSRRAASMIPPTILSAIAGRRALVDWSDAEPGDEVAHMTLGAWAELGLIMPATANLLAKVAHGIADDLLSTTILAAGCPMVFAPSMNRTMWEKPATRRNVEQLRADGYTVLDPVYAVAVADGTVGIGGMPDIATIVRQVAAVVTRDERTRAMAR